MKTLLTTYDVAVCIGRFQPLHFGHLALLESALAQAAVCVVVIGSAFQARTPKNPFTWSERAEMIRLALPQEGRDRVHFLPMRDYYDEARWSSAVCDGVTHLLKNRDPDINIRNTHVTLVGHFKDATSEYLRAFPNWTFHNAERHYQTCATALRNAFFGSNPTDMQATLAALVEQAPTSTLNFMRAWAQLTPFALLAKEWEMLRDYRQAWKSAPYPPVFVTVDAVVRCADNVLLVRRGQAPGKGLLAVPGGFIEQRETTYQSALRELQEETHFSILADSMRNCLKSVAVFDHPDRSQRGRTITHAHYFDLGERSLPEVKAGDDAAQAMWIPISDLASLEDQFLDDNFHMLDHFLEISDRF